MKYIIDLPDNCSWVQWIMTSDKDGHAYFDFKSPEDLTPLDKELEEACQRGQDDAWKAITKIAKMPDGEREKVFGDWWILNILNKFSASEIINILDGYDPERDEIKVGDEIEDKTGEKLVIASIDPSTKQVCAIGGDGHAYGFFAGDYKKTGKTYPQVEELLKAMKGEKRDCHTCKHQVASSIECVDCRGFGMWEPKEGAE